MKRRIIRISIWVIIIGAAFFVAFWLSAHYAQNGPGIIQGAYYVSGDKGKVIVINDEVSETVGGGRGGNVYQNSYCWLIELDATIGKVLKRKESNFLDYFGMDGGYLFMISSDSAVKLHSMDPYSLEIVEGYKSILEKAQAKNPVFKNKIASWETDEYSGNILITSFDATKYAVSPVTFEANDFTNHREDKNKVKGLSSVGVYEQDQGHFMAYTDSTCYQLDGRESMQIFKLDKYSFGPTDTPTAGCEPCYVTKKHVLCDQHFIDGAFMYDAFTCKPLRFEDGNGTFIYHLDRLGAGGKNMITHLDRNGTVTMECDITQTDSTSVLKEVFIADGKLYLVFSRGVQARDASGKLLWQYTEDTMENH